MKILHDFLLKNNYTISTVESCTAGLLSCLMTYYSGSSNFFNKGFIVYSDEAKSNILGIPNNLIKKYSAVSAKICAEMLNKCKYITKSDIVLATTGYLDHYNDIENNGKVFMGIKFLNRDPIIVEKNYTNERNENRMNAINDIIGIVVEAIFSR